MSAMVRITEEMRETLQRLAEETGEPMQQVLAKAVKAYRRQRVLELTNAAYAELRADPQAWREILDERAEWDGTLADRLRDDEYLLDEGLAVRQPAGS